ncbi:MULTISPECIES: ABC transporter permease [unclassified Allobranchiibius]|uniref:ABC transporter permease n=1 Tax=unclassified Allobranchiibius TaxID=2649857 RepID=UPI001AA13FEE|nr:MULTISPECIES: ABC transporter permease [unclassified Allobranchiibius]MBO1766230.1 ABC transporter permease [Allobranchiibius sp. GilTou38]UIJ34163.1 ABC transporter permease [Allobranchiibius sp. GilTou73]
MFTYIVRRLIGGVVMLIVVSFVTFLLFFSSGTNPAQYTCGKTCTPAIVEQNSKVLGYNEPVIEQWGRFVQGIAVGRDYPVDKSMIKDPNTIVHCSAPCLGYSPQLAQTVTQTLKPRIGVSASLALAAFVMWMILGVGFGLVAAVRRGGLLDKTLVGVALMAYAMPTVVTALVLYQFLVIKWQVFPTPEYVGITNNPASWFVGLLLPGLTLALFYAGAYVRLTRAFILETLGQDFLRTAKAKGVAPRRILFKHTLRAALTPIVTQAGLDFGAVLGGAIITENVFGYPGLGQIAAQSAVTFDLPTTVGVVLILATFVIIANLVVDVLYGFIDPRVKLV